MHWQVPEQPTCIIAPCEPLLQAAIHSVWRRRACPWMLYARGYAVVDGKANMLGSQRRRSIAVSSIADPAASLSSHHGTTIQTMTARPAPNQHFTQKAPGLSVAPRATLWVYPRVVRLSGLVSSLAVVSLPYQLFCLRAVLCDASQKATPYCIHWSLVLDGAVVTVPSLGSVTLE